MNEMKDIARLLDGLPAPALIVDAHRKIVAANAPMQEMVDEPVIGRRFVRVMRHPDALETIAIAVDTKKREHSKIAIELPVRRILDFSAFYLGSMADMTELVLVTMTDMSPFVEINRTRSSFVANVSHELRSPLATLSGIVETLRGPAKDDVEARERFLGLMQAEADRMSRLIDDLLSLSKLEAKSHVRPKQQVNLPAILQRVVDGISVRTLASEHKIMLSSDLDSTNSLVGDEDELIEVFQNLIENAVKYSPKGSVVTINAFCKKNSGKKKLITVEVEDHGEGIEPHHIPRLTERFYRIDKGRSREMGGTGLGLAITKHIVNRHRGSLQFNSRLGEGTRVIVNLPGNQT